MLHRYLLLYTFIMNTVIDVLKFKKKIKLLKTIKCVAYFFLRN